MILTLNVGSSSVKFAVFEGEGKRLSGIVSRLWDNPSLKIQYPSEQVRELNIERDDYDQVLTIILDIMKENGIDPEKISGVCHRIVHGGDRFTGITLLTDENIKRISELSGLAPLHNPVNIKGVISAKRVLPWAEHVGVFDTQFHASMEERFYLYPIPITLYKKYGIRRYGFHGTSHKYVYLKGKELYERYTGHPPSKVITAHIGNGASITAIRDGKVINTSMGLTPLEGLMMGTRCGDIDPGIIFHLHRLGYEIEEIDNILNRSSGLKAIAGTNHMREIERRYREGDKSARLALEMYTDRIVKYISWYHVLLGGADLLVFTGGIGENSSLVRSMVLEKLGVLGIVYDTEANEKNQELISSSSSEIMVMVIPTDEELEMVREYLDWKSQDRKTYTQC